MLVTTTDDGCPSKNCQYCYLQFCIYSDLLIAADRQILLAYSDCEGHIISKFSHTKLELVETKETIKSAQQGLVCSPVPHL